MPVLGTREHVEERVWSESISEAGLVPFGRRRPGTYRRPQRRTSGRPLAWLAEARSCLGQSQSARSGLERASGIYKHVPIHDVPGGLRAEHPPRHFETDRADDGEERPSARPYHLVEVGEAGDAQDHEGEDRET